ncbi:DUF3137 domain-containing protein [Pontibacter sp. G13]|uniref:DUF3137 domain-containing protein n=1 Tax=Pontibacter sp. G13 TaxID=3074898 RepID=UPI0028892B4D|nr:DUF3137 domain-containing protein [Pontibacter sp. G13]WNJ18338.1 DUF3137 domain-containing protein [Pontibacter sp. G13]
MSKIDLFGKHKREIWQQLAEQIDGDFFRGKMFRPDRVEAYYGDWMVTLDTYTVDKAVYTRIRAPYVNRDDFVFKIFREHAGHRLIKALGMEDIEVGHPEFDQDFVIQGSDERKLQMMFANPKIRQLISFQPKIILQLKREAGLFQKPPFPKDVNELYYQVGGILKNLEQLHDLFDLFAETLDHLCAIGTAYEDDPKFKYYT